MVGVVSEGEGRPEDAARREGHGAQRLARGGHYSAGEVVYIAIRPRSRTSQVAGRISR